MRKFYKLFFLVVSLLFFLAATDSYARAGGGSKSSSSSSYHSSSSSRSSSSSSWSSGSSWGRSRTHSSFDMIDLYILMAIVVVVVLYVLITSIKRPDSLFTSLFPTTYKREGKQLANDPRATMQQYEALDKAWNYHAIRSRIQYAFMEVQKAWMERNQDLAREFMTDRLYNKHKQLTDEMLASGVRNILEQIRISNAIIVSVSDNQDNSKHTFSALIKGSLIDYKVNEQTNQLLAGNASNPTEFAEMWTFIRQGEAWMVDEISQNPDTLNPAEHVKPRMYAMPVAA